MSKSVEHAINTLNCLKELGYKGQLTWALTTRGLQPNQENINDDDLKSGAINCADISLYILMWLHDEPYDILANYRDESIFPRIPVTTVRHLEPDFWVKCDNGVYYVDLDSAIVSAVFVIIIKDDKLIYASCHGEELKVVTHDRKEWQSDFDRAVTGDVESYGRIFYRTVYWSKLSRICIKRSPTYH